MHLGMVNKENKPGKASKPTHSAKVTADTRLQTKVSHRKTDLHSTDPSLPPLFRASL